MEIYLAEGAAGKEWRPGLHAPSSPPQRSAAPPRGRRPSAASHRLPEAASPATAHPAVSLNPATPRTSWGGRKPASPGRTRGRSLDGGGDRVRGRRLGLGAELGRGGDRVWGRSLDGGGAWMRRRPGLGAELRWGGDRAWGRRPALGAVLGFPGGCGGRCSCVRSATRLPGPVWKAGRPVRRCLR